MATQPDELPATQYAVQLVGPGVLRLNKAKPVPRPGPYQILAKIECVGLCFSDLKLLKQFDQHPRKSEILGGLPREILFGIPSYVPGDKPTVPGHEVTCRIIEVGDRVKHYQVGERCLVQADFRDLPTASSNGAFGYNFEGALQEYVLLDERVIIDSCGERMLLKAGEERSASAVALVEPWACVEDSYVTRERQTIKGEGKLLIVAEKGTDTSSVEKAFDPKRPPAQVLLVTPDKAGQQPDQAFDDIVYFGADKEVLDLLNDKLAMRGLINVVLGGKTIGRPVHVGVGAIHYRLNRWIGTTGPDASASYRLIPATGEVRPHDRCLVVGAGGPMGQMHVLRNLSLGLPGVEVVGADVDDARLEALAKKAFPVARANRVALRLVNTQATPLREKFTYLALMAPLPQLVAQAIQDAAEGAIINVFAGIPATAKHDLDLDALIAKRCFLYGTSGSTIVDLKIVLQKVEAGQLNTNASVDAISGMAGAAEGISAVENRTLAGKIIVYPMLHEVPLIPLNQLEGHFPTVAAKLDHGQWTREAEEELLRVAG